MRRHDIKSYSDSWKKIDYCAICGKEGNEIIGTDCPGEIINESVDKKLDNKLEPS